MTEHDTADRGDIFPQIIKRLDAVERQHESGSRLIDGLVNGHREISARLLVLEEVRHQEAVSAARQEERDRVQLERFAELREEVRANRKATKEELEEARAQAANDTGAIRGDIKKVVISLVIAVGTALVSFAVAKATGQI